MRRSILSLAGPGPIVLCGAVLLAWSAVGRAEEPYVRDGRRFQLREIEVNGARRTVVTSDHGDVQLYLDRQYFLAGQHPGHGFHGENTFHNSCGPDAAANLLLWANLVPGYSEALVYELGERMQTDEWLAVEVGGVVFELGDMGTLTSAVRQVLEEEVAGRAAGDGRPLAVRYRPDTTARSADRLGEIERQLAQGHPLLVVHKTGPRGGHFALIVGVRRDRSGAPIIQMANGRPGDDVPWVEFEEGWRRNYVLELPLVPDVQLDRFLAVLGELPYTYLSIEPCGRLTAEEGAGDACSWHPAPAS
jgi:hypothetical protein